jgi:hypothetical protein
LKDRLLESIDFGGFQKAGCMKLFVYALTFTFLGFWLYPMLFVPLLAKFAPIALDKWAEIYAAYLKGWGL